MAYFTGMAAAATNTGLILINQSNRTIAIFISRRFTS